MMLFYVFILFIPLQFALNPAEGVDLAIGRVLAVLLMAALFLKGLKDRSFVISPTPLSLFLFLFLFWSGISLFWGEDASAGVRKFFFFLNFFPLFWLFPILAKRGLSGVEPFLIYPACMVSLIGVAQFSAQFIIGVDGVLALWRGITPFVYGNAFGEAILTHPSWLVEVAGATLFRAIGLFPDPHIFGFYLAFVTPLALLSRRKLFKAFGVLFALVLLLTFSRAAYFGAIGALVSYLTLMAAERKAQKITFFLAALFFSLSVLGLALTPFGSRFFSSFNVLEGSVAGRLEIWREATSVISEHSLLGVGLGSYAAATEPGADYRLPIYVHNLYLDIAAELGLVGLGLWISIIALALMYSFKNAQYPLFFTLVWFSIQSFFDTPFFSVHILPLLMIFFSLIDDSVNFRSQSSKISGAKHLI